MFLIHQLLSTEGVIIACAWLTHLVWPYVSRWNPAWRSVRLSWLLTEVPMFPLQTLASLILGFCALAQVSPQNDVWGLDTAILDSLRRILCNPRITPCSLCVLLRSRMHATESFLHSGRSYPAGSHICCICHRLSIGEGDFPHGILGDGSTDHALPIS